MISSMDAQRLVVSALLSFVACGSAVAIDWPKTYVVAEDTTSPDGKYALIVQNAENGAMNTGPIAGTDAVFLANIPEHKVIGEIKDVDYFERMNSRHLSAQWLDDSSACLVLESHWLYGVYGVHVVERTGQSIQQTDLMKRMLAMINPAEDRLNFYFRFETGPKVVVRATVPARQLEQTKSSAMFRGTFDIPAKRWGAVNVRRVTFQEHEAIESALAADPKEYIVVSRKAGEVADAAAHANEQIYPSEEKRFKALDELLNDVYAADRILLPAARFSRLKDEQREWLKQLVAAPTLTDKSKLMQQRIKVLQDLLWQD